MRTINKRPPPSALVQWRQRRIAAHDQAVWPFDFDELRRDPDVISAVALALCGEQGYICAYTGIQIGIASDNRPTFHIEHLKPQARCKLEEDFASLTDYNNLVACWPAPNPISPAQFGAERKGDWPSATEDRNFVSPLSPACSNRFEYKRSGAIAAREGDVAAAETIKNLALDHKALEIRRKSAIQRALEPKRGKRLPLAGVRKIQNEMERADARLQQGENVILREFCFAIKPAVDRQVRKLEARRRASL